MDILEVYERQKNGVYRLALTYLHSAAEAQDVCHDAFLKLLECQDQVLPGKERAWLATVTVNLCKNRLRFWKLHRQEPLSETLSLPGPEENEVLNAVMALGVKERTAVYLHYYEGYSTEEVGKILGISQTAVTTRLARARAKLRDRLEEGIE